MTALMRTAALAAGCVGGLGAVYGLLFEQASRARRTIGLPDGAPLRADGVYLPDGTGPLAPQDDRASSATAPIRLAMLGDSSAAGVGAEIKAHLPGVLVARGLAESAQRPVRLDTYAVSGSTSRDLAPQGELALANSPDVALVLIGANDVTRRIHPQTAAALLGEAVRTLCAEGVVVVVGTCPDLGVVQPIPQPLRGVAHTWSLTLARLQRAAVQRAGGYAVPLADLLASEFMSRADYFSRDRFHPSDTGYQAAAAVLLPTVCTAIGARGQRARQRRCANRGLDRLLRRPAVAQV